MVVPVPQPGDLFQERYRIDSVIGSGGFAHIYLATERGIDRKVAIKVLKASLVSPAHSDDTNATKVAKRFRREARLVAKLRDPHTITMFDHGQTDEGLLYMVFEYIDGRSLKQVTRDEGPISPDRVVFVLEQVLSSLQEAHAVGVLHRDIKPANIMLFEHVGRTDQVKVLDFGIAKAVMTDATQTLQDLTEDGKLIGTPRYMSPEQLRGADIGPQTDLFSLGLVAYELLVGERANQGDSNINVITLQVSPPSFRLPDDLEMPDGLRSIVDGMLERDPSRRFRSADHVLDALEGWDSPQNLSRNQDSVAQVDKVGLPAEAVADMTTMMLDRDASQSESDEADEPGRGEVAARREEPAKARVAVDLEDDGESNGVAREVVVGMVLLLGAGLVAAAVGVFDEASETSKQDSDQAAVVSADRAAEDEASEGAGESSSPESLRKPPQEPEVDDDTTGVEKPESRGTGERPTTDKRDDAPGVDSAGRDDEPTPIRSASPDEQTVQERGPESAHDESREGSGSERQGDTDSTASAEQVEADSAEPGGEESAPGEPNFPSMLDEQNAPPTEPEPDSDRENESTETHFDSVMTDP